jgi:hypothetical protein
VNKKLITAAFFILFMGLIGIEAEVKAGPIKVSTRPGPETEPTKVETAIWFLDIDGINSAAQTFDANVFIGLTWKDPSLAHSGTGSVIYPLDEIWNPASQISNEGRLVRRTLPETAMVQPDGTVTYSQRYVGVFSQPLHLDDFPFDKHRFKLQLIAPTHTPEEVQFVPEEKWVERGLPYAAGMSKDLSLPDWKILDFKTKDSPLLIMEGYENAGYAFEFTAKRFVKYYLLKVIMPLIFIVMMSWVVFWIDPINSGSQIAASITSMLTLIAYRFAIDTHVPKVSYTTRMDEFIFMSTLIVFIALMQVIVTSSLAQNNKGSSAIKVDKISRIVFPLVFFVATYLTLFN